MLSWVIWVKVEKFFGWIDEPQKYGIYNYCSHIIFTDFLSKVDSDGFHIEYTVCLQKKIVTILTDDAVHSLISNLNKWRSNQTGWIEMINVQRNDNAKR